VYHSYQFDAIVKSNIEKDMGFSVKTSDPFLPNFRPFATHQWLLRQVADDVIESTQIAIGPWLTGVIGDVAPDIDEIPTSSRSAIDTRHDQARRE
jgi:hypothetical protein